MSDKRMPALTVVVLRGLHAAMKDREMNIQCSEPGDYHSAQLEEYQRAAMWLDAFSERKGWGRLFPKAVQDAVVRSSPRERKIARQANAIAESRRKVRVR